MCKLTLIFYEYVCGVSMMESRYIGMAFIMYLFIIVHAGYVIEDGNMYQLTIMDT